jgi:hypothetical protein
MERRRAIDEAEEQDRAKIGRDRTEMGESRLGVQRGYRGFVHIALLLINNTFHQWTNKAYDFTSSEPIPFPQPLAETCKSVVQGIPWDEVFGNVDDVCGDGYEDGGRIRPDGYENWGEDYCERLFQWICLSNGF